MSFFCVINNNIWKLNVVQLYRKLRQQQLILNKFVEVFELLKQYLLIELLTKNKDSFQLNPISSMMQNNSTQKIIDKKVNHSSPNGSLWTLFCDFPIFEKITVPPSIKTTEHFSRCNLPVAQPARSDAH